MKRILRTYWPLVLLIIVAGILRFINLDRLPFGFHTDELSAGYIGRYIFLHKGFDIQGHRFPLYYDAFGDFRPIGIFLLSGLSTFIFGVNEFAVRFPSAFFVALTVIPLYFLCERLLRNRTVSTLACLFLAVSPWHIVLSRATSEGVIGLFFLLSGLMCLFYYIDTHTPSAVYLGAFCFLISYLLYHTFRVFIPIIIFPLYFHPKITFRQKNSIAILFSLFLCLTALVSFTNFGTGRFKQVMFVSSPQIQNITQKFIQGEGPNNALKARIFHNKPVIYTREFLRLYSEYFSPSYLFSKGGLPNRYAVPDTGLFPWIFTIFFGIGLVVLVTNHTFAHNFIIYFMLVSPLPAAITYEDTPNINRAICFMIPLIIISAVGLGKLANYLLMKKIHYRILSCIIVIFMAEIIYFWHQYSIHEKDYSSFWRNDMYREMMQKIAAVHTSYDTVYVSHYNSIPLYYLFYTNSFVNTSPNIFTPDGINKQLGNIRFVDAECPAEVSKYVIQGENALYVNKGDCPKNTQFTIIEIMRQHDGARAFQFAVKKN